MPVSVEYVARETASNLWREPADDYRRRAHGGRLAQPWSERRSCSGRVRRTHRGSGTRHQGHRVDAPKANQQEIRAVGTQLTQLNTVRQPCAYWNKARNYADASKLLPSDEMQGSTESAVSDLVLVYAVTLADANQVILTFKGTPGVMTVTAPIQQIHTEEKVINALKWVFLAIAVVLIVSATVLILNSIRMAIFARRREVSVMKLVGATNSFIRVPFMSEGLIQGLLGAAISAGGVYILYLFINHAGGGNNSSNVFSAMRLTGAEVFWTDIVVVFVGVLIGSLGSAIAIRRFLDV